MAANKKINKKPHDQSFYLLANSVANAIRCNEDGSVRKDQVDLMTSLEERFRKEVIKTRQGREVYKKFILKIMVENGRVGSAQPYFREKQEIFNSYISPAITDGKIEALQKFHINFNLIEYIHSQWLGPFPKKAQKIYEDFKEARRVVIENNMPLAINRAKIFYRKTPENHLSLMDLIGIACVGLISGIDKHSGPYTPMFAGVCVGRMTGNLIRDYSETVLHFYPADMSLIYRANSLRAKKQITSIDKLVDAINESYETDKTEGRKTPNKKVTVSELSMLLAASSPIGVGDTVMEGSSEGFGEKRVSAEEHSFFVSQDESPEDALEHRDLRQTVSSQIADLQIMERKTIRLKGVNL
jgi:DNA-directed RNA polymerase specialized sigma subunit